MPLNAIKGNLPRRHASTHLVYHGERLVLVSQRHGKDLDIRVTPAEADSRYFDVFRHLLTRDVHPLSYISLETINDEKARRSPWLDVFRQLFEVNVGVKRTSASWAFGACDFMKKGYRHRFFAWCVGIAYGLEACTREKRCQSPFFPCCGPVWTATLWRPSGLLFRLRGAPLDFSRIPRWVAPTKMNLRDDAGS